MLSVLLASIVLSQASSSFGVQLGGAVTSSECPYFASVHEAGGAAAELDREVFGSTTGATPVVVVPVPTPPRRVEINFFALRNSDAAPVIAQVHYTKSTTTILWRGTLQPGDTLQYTGANFQVIDSQGRTRASYSIDLLTGGPIGAVLTATGLENPPVWYLARAPLPRSTGLPRPYCNAVLKADWRGTNCRTK